MCSMTSSSSTSYLMCSMTTLSRTLYLMCSMTTSSSTSSFPSLMSSMSCKSKKPRKVRQKKKKKIGGGSCPPGKCLVFGGGKCPNLGVVNVRILGVVNVRLANNLTPWEAWKWSALSVTDNDHGHQASPAYSSIVSQLCVHITPAPSFHALCNRDPPRPLLQSVLIVQLTSSGWGLAQARHSCRMHRQEDSLQRPPQNRVFLVRPLCCSLPGLRRSRS